MSNTQKARPLSPHLQVYKPQLTSILSIFHRGSGVFLSLGTPLLVYWLWAISAGNAYYIEAMHFLYHGMVQLVLFAWTAAFCYHLCNGIRHLFWDMGKGFELKDLYFSGYMVLGVSSVLTLLIWAIAKGVL